MAKKKRSNSNHNEDRKGLAKGMVKPTIEKETVSLQSVIQKTLEGLDSVIDEANNFLHSLEMKKTKMEMEKSNENGNNIRASAIERKNKYELLSALSFPHLEQLRQVVVRYGIQLLPYLYEIKDRLLLCLQIDILSSPLCWELCGLLAIYYRGSFVKGLETILNYVLLKKKEGVLLFHNDCFCLEADREHFLTGAMTEGEMVAPSTPARKLAALEQMLTGAGPFLPFQTLQTFALRYAMEWIEMGLTPSRQRFEEDTLLSMDSATSAGETSIMKDRTKGLEREVQCFLYHSGSTAASINLLTTLLQICRPTPSALLTTATRVLHRIHLLYQPGTWALTTAEEESTTTQDHWVALAVEASVRLSVALFQLRNPTSFPHYSAPQVVVEQAKRKVFLEEEVSAPQQQETPVVIAAVSTPPKVAETAEETMRSVQHVSASSITSTVIHGKNSNTVELSLSSETEKMVKSEREATLPTTATVEKERDTESGDSSSDDFPEINLE